MREKVRTLKRMIGKTIEEEKRRKRFEEKNIFVGEGTSIADECKIGMYTYIGLYSTIECANIGNYVSIGDHVTIGPGEHRIKWASTSHRIYKDRIGAEYYNGDNEKLTGGISIGNDVWIGCNATIRRGVRIGSGACVGANSFVNKDVPDFAIVGGVPARVIKYRVEKSIIEEIQRSRWWEYDLEEARSVIYGLEKKLGIVSLNTD